MRSPFSMLAVIMLTACPTSVFAHKVGVSATVRGDKVEVEAYYEDNMPAVKAKVHVLDAEEYFVATGVTDEKGRWVFAKPGSGTYKVLLDAGAGHRAKTTLTVPGVVKEPAPEEPTTPAAKSEREEFTHFPWMKLLVGLAVIGGGCGIFLIVSRLRLAAHGRSPEANG